MKKQRSLFASQSANIPSQMKFPHFPDKAASGQLKEEGDELNRPLREINNLIPVYNKGDTLYRVKSQDTTTLNEPKMSPAAHLSLSQHSKVQVSQLTPRLALTTPPTSVHSTSASLSAASGKVTMNPVYTRQLPPLPPVSKTPVEFSQLISGRSPLYDMIRGYFHLKK